VEGTKKIPCGFLPPLLLPAQAIGYGTAEEEEVEMASAFVCLLEKRE
jgi:hypothetical protein